MSRPTRGRIGLVACVKLRHPAITADETTEQDSCLDDLKGERKKASLDIQESFLASAGTKVCASPFLPVIDER